MPALGINTTTTKLTAFAIGAMFAGFAGSFFATRQGFISPESFTFNESALILAIVVLGGMGSQLGVAVAALVMLGGFELFRELPALSHAGLRLRHGADHGLAAARSRLDARAVAAPRLPQGAAGMSPPEPILEGRASDACALAVLSPSTICRSRRSAATSPR